MKSKRAMRCSLAHSHWLVVLGLALIGLAVPAQAQITPPSASVPKAWFRADTGVDVRRPPAEHEVVGWRDALGSGLNFVVESAGPRLGDDGPNARATLHFPGNVRFRNARLPQFFTPDATTVFLVCREEASTGTPTYFALYFGDTWVRFVSLPDGRLDWHCGHRDDPVLVDTPADWKGRWHLVTLRVGGGVGTIRIDGREVARRSGIRAAQAEATDTLFVGEGGRETQFYGALAEIMFYGSALDASEVERVEWYLSERYALPLQPEYHPIYESFDWAAATDLAAIPGSGWHQPRSPTSNRLLIQPDSLDASGVEGAVAGHLALRGGRDGALRRDLPVALRAGTVYASLRLRVDDTLGLSDRPSPRLLALAGVGIEGCSTDENDPGPVSCPALQVFLRAYGDGFQVGLGNPGASGGEIHFADAVFRRSQPLVLAVAYSFQPPPESDEARLWIGTESSGWFDSVTAPSPQVSYPSRPEVHSIDRVLLCEWDFDMPALVRIDDLRIGATWESIVPWGRDWGDAPDSYATLGTDGGPYHRLRPGWRLGSGVDPDVDGIPSPSADGDDVADASDDESGLRVLGQLVPGLPTQLSIEASVPTGSNAFLNGWIDFNRDGRFEGADEHVVDDLPTATPGVTPVIKVPLAALSGSTFARLRLNASPGVSPEGPGGAGEVEDHRMEIKAMDFGDLPDTFHTSKSVDGARHLVVPLVFLGAGVDAEDDGSPGISSEGDDLFTLSGVNDEDGVFFPPLVAGTAVDLTVVASTLSGLPTYLDAWIDWNRDGDFDEPDEQLFKSVEVMHGSNTLPCRVPVTAALGGTHARFRLSLSGGLSYVGYASSGEVEDYGPTRVTIVRGVSKGVDLAVEAQPDSFVVAEGERIEFLLTVINKGLTTAPDVMMEIRVPTGATLESIVVGQGSIERVGDHVLLRLGTLEPGARVPVRLGSGPAQVPAESLEESSAWHWFKAAIVWSSEWELASADNTKRVTFAVPIPHDFGDAPASPYVTCLPAGPRHLVVGAGGYRMGTAIDAEPDCQPDDSAAGVADEDGVTFSPPPPWVPGTLVSATVHVVRPATFVARLDAWFDGDGIPGFQLADRLFTGLVLPTIGANPLPPFVVPATAVPGTTWLRFRLSQAGVAGPGGYAPDGEVEDYRAEITTPLPILVVAREEGGSRLEWTCAECLLEESTAITGPFITVAGAKSPQMIPLEGPMRAFRLRKGPLPFEIPTTAQSAFFSSNAIIAPPPPGDRYFGQDAQYVRPPMDYLDNGDGTVTDRTTGLTWAQAVVGPISWADALAGAKTYGLAGKTDWRVPSVKELYSLFDARGVFGTTATASKPFLDTNSFAFAYGTSGRFFDVQQWSSTEYVGLTMGGDPSVFGVNFADGRIKGYPKMVVPKTIGPLVENLLYVRYVRGNEDYGRNGFQDMGDGTIFDHATGLHWMKEDSGKDHNWEEALAYAEGLTFAGHGDWRLPTIKELQSIVDYTRSPATTGTAAIDTTFFPNTSTNTYYWSSTTLIDGIPGANHDKAAYIAFGEALGFFGSPPSWRDVHGAGSERVDFKSGDPLAYPAGFGPQGDRVVIRNRVRAVRGGLR